MTATFADGSTSTGAHLVGADGAKSLLRTLLLDPERAVLASLPIAMYDFKTGLSHSESLCLKSAFHLIMNFGIHSDTNTLFVISILDMPDKNDAGAWVWQIFYSMMGEDNNKKVLVMTSQDRLAMFRRKAEGWVDPLKSVIGYSCIEKILLSNTISGP